MSESLNYFLSQPDNYYGVLHGGGQVVSGLALVGLVIYAIPHLRFSYTLFMGLSTLTFLTQSFLISVPRFMLTVFPVFFLLGSLLRWRVGGLLLLSSSVALLTLMTVRFIHGWWAF